MPGGRSPQDVFGLGSAVRVNPDSPQLLGLQFWAPMVQSRRDVMRNILGSLAGSAAFVPDAMGTCLAADGTDGSADMLTFAHGATTDFAASDFTVSFWVRNFGFVAQGSSINCFIAKGGMAANPGWGIGTRGDDTISCWVNGFEVNPAVVLTSSWQHVAFTRDISTGALAIYRNGLSIATDTGDTNTVSSAGNDLGIGGDTTNGSREAACRIRDVRFYFRTLSAREVWPLYDPRTRFDLYARPVYDLDDEEVAAAATTRPHLLLLGVS